MKKLTKEPRWITRSELWITIVGICLICVVMAAVLAANFVEKQPDQEIYVFPFGEYACSKTEINGISAQSCIKTVNNGTINEGSTKDSPTNIKIEVKQ